MSIPATMKAVVIQSDQCVVKDDVPVPKLGMNMALIKTKAVAGNPTDWKHIDFKIGPQGSILGCDVAGEIVELGPNSDSKWAVGDTLCTMVHGASVRYPENGAYAEYVRVDLAASIKLPLKPADKDVLPEGRAETFEGAVAMPVGLLTAAQLLCLNFGNKLEWEPAQPQHDHPILIWGGATSCGQYLTQLCRKLNAYSRVIVVASKKHETRLKKLGADEIYDYHDEDVIERITRDHPDLYHLVDAVSNPETLRLVYKCAPISAPVRLVQLTHMSAKGIIPEEELKSNVEVDGTMLYQISGEDVTIGNITLPASPAYRKQAISFVEFITPKVADGSIVHIPVKVFQGLESVPTILRDIKHGKSEGHKLVAKL
ncbi:AaceriAFR066Cp [[Ashbya] aceris (nom. inval.)]|nr:AaceriAFR066Cp [[Ashbya] aceris (nom. inval.)]